MELFQETANFINLNFGLWGVKSKYNYFYQLCITALYLEHMSFNNPDRSSSEVEIEDSLEAKVEDI